MKKLFSIAMLLSSTSFGFVAGPSAVNENENYLSLGLQSERGKIEPNENKASYQNAHIDVYRLKYVKGLGDALGFGRANVYTEYGSFASSEEKIGNQLFYEKDKGSFLNLGLSIDLIHDLEKQFGLYVQVTPLKDYNKDKFSNPRIDKFAFGINSAFSVTENFFQKSLIHYGSGDGSSQNSYLAIDAGFGYKLNHLIGRQMTLTGSLFLEVDTSERKDDKYDIAFSPSGSPDRIRAFKYGTLVGFDVALTKDVNLNANFLQKLGGYDARSTEIYTVSLGFKF